MPARSRVCFDGEEDVWEHELWDAAEIFDETTISAAFQQQLRKAITKLDRDLNQGLQHMDRRILEMQNILQLRSPPAPGVSDLHLSVVSPSRSPNNGSHGFPTPKSWASPFQDSVEALRTASERQARLGPPRISIFASRRSNYPVKEALWDFLVDPLSSWAAWYFSVLYTPLVLILVACMLLQSAMPQILQPLLAAEIALQMPFLVEVFGRCMCSWSWYRYFSDFGNIIDLLALVSLVFSVLALVEATDAVMQVKWCVFPTLHMMKLLRLCPQLHVVCWAFLDSWQAIFMLFLSCSLLLLPLASVLFLLGSTSEQTLPQAVYYLLLVMTTVGSGSGNGETGRQLITAMAVICSLLCLVVPLSILNTQRWQDRDVHTFVHQLGRALKDWGWTEEYFEKVMLDFDTAGSGRLSLENFHRMAKELHISFGPQRLVHLFHTLDRSQTPVPKDWWSW
eukprot:symbB.v1.2.005247.t1/scaffold304.1/size234131/6